VRGRRAELFLCASKRHNKDSEFHAISMGSMKFSFILYSEGFHQGGDG